MSQTEADQTAVQEPFSLTLDQYRRIWLHTKLNGIEVAIDLADEHQAFSIMAERMAERGFAPRFSRVHDEADNDDQPRGYSDQD